MPRNRSEQATAREEALEKRVRMYATAVLHLSDELRAVSAELDNREDRAHAVHANRTARDIRFIPYGTLMSENCYLIPQEVLAAIEESPGDI